MTPSEKAPSMHEIMTGFFQPNAGDIGAGFKGGFGSTTFIASDGDDCKWNESQESINRRTEYARLLTEFGLSSSEQNMECKQTWQDWNYSGSHMMGLNFINTQCNGMVQHITPYTIFRADDFKRCICDRDGEPDECAPASTDGNDGSSGSDGNAGDSSSNDGSGGSSDSNGGNDSNNDSTGGSGGDSDSSGGSGGDTDSSGGSSGNDDTSGGSGGQTNDSLVQEMFEQIWNNPNYSQDQVSYTLFQVNQQLDLIETVLLEFQQAMEDKGIIMVQQ